MKTPFLKIIVHALLVFALLSGPGCAHLIYLDQAQSSFNTAATLENAARFKGAQATDWDAETRTAQQELTNSPELYYTLAYGQVRKALQRESELKKNGVLSSAYTIQALCEWKLGNHVRAEESAKNSLRAMKADGQTRLPRDEAMMTALPGLMKTDKAYAVYQEIYDRSFGDFAGVLNSAEAAKTAYLGFKNKFAQNWDNEKQRPSAFSDYEKALAVPGLNDATRFYLLTSELGTAKTWLETQDKLETIFRKLFEIENQSWLAQETQWIFTERKWLKDHLCRYQQTRTKLLAELKDLAPKVAGENQETIVKNWGKWLVDMKSSCR